MRFSESRGTTAVLLTVSKNFIVDMHSDVWELIWFKLGMMIDTVKFDILVLVYVALTMIQGHRSARKQKRLWQLSHKVCNRFG